MGRGILIELLKKREGKCSVILINYFSGKAEMEKIFNILLIDS